MLFGERAQEDFFPASLQRAFNWPRRLLGWLKLQALSLRCYRGVSVSSMRRPRAVTCGFLLDLSVRYRSHLPRPHCTSVVYLTPPFSIEINVAERVTFVPSRSRVVYTPALRLGSTMKEKTHFSIVDLFEQN
mgnify:CR=1 FL=1